MFPSGTIGRKKSKFSEKCTRLGTFVERMPLKAGKFPIGHIEACGGSSKRKVSARVKSEQEMVMTVDLQSGSAWQQIKGLKHEAYFLIPDFSKFVLRHFAYLLAVQHIGP